MISGPRGTNRATEECLHRELVCEAGRGSGDSKDLYRDLGDSFWE